MKQSPFEFSGGNLCLDFANTVNDRVSDHPEDLLGSYHDVLRWGQESAALPRKTAERLAHLAVEAGGHSTTAFRSAVQLREAIYAIFSAVAARRVVPGTALGVLNTVLQRAAEHARIVPGNRNFAWEWIMPEANLDSVLWPIARSAADLLTSTELPLVRSCASDDCTWLFLDHTKNHRRRWCDMKTCGNRAKARRYYARNRA